MIYVEPIHFTNEMYDIVAQWFDDIKEDGVSVDDIGKYVDNRFYSWLVAYNKEGEILALMRTSKFTQGVMEIHPFVNKKYRNKSTMVIRALFQFIQEHRPKNMTHYVTMIPEELRYAVRFAYTLGFTLIGRIENGYLKNSQYSSKLIFQRGI